MSLCYCAEYKADSPWLKHPCVTNIRHGLLHEIYVALSAIFNSKESSCKNLDIIKNVLNKSCPNYYKFLKLKMHLMIQITLRGINGKVCRIYPGIVLHDGSKQGDIIESYKTLARDCLTELINSMIMNIQGYIAIPMTNMRKPFDKIFENFDESIEEVLQASINIKNQFYALCNLYRVLKKENTQFYEYFSHLEYDSNLLDLQIWIDDILNDYSFSTEESKENYSDAMISM